MKQNLPGGLSAVVPPDPMPNSEVKRRSADGSVGSPHVRVGNCQTLIKKNPSRKAGVFCFAEQKGKSIFGLALNEKNRFLGSFVSIYLKRLF